MVNRAYYFLIVFASFLNETKAETWRELLEMSSYEAYVKTHPVFKTIERELDTEDQGVLAPLEKLDFAGVAFTDEVAEFVSRRKGRILSAFTLLKSDFFVSYKFILLISMLCATTHLVKFVSNRLVFKRCLYQSESKELLTSDKLTLLLPTMNAMPLLN